MGATPKRLLLEQGQCLVLQPALAKHVGKSGALFLQQLHYWLSSAKEMGTIAQGKRWIYNSAKEWALQLCLSERQVTRIISHLKEVGILLIDRFGHRKSDRTNWYSIDYQALENLLPQVSWHPQKTKPVLKAYDSFTASDKMSGSFRHNDGFYKEENKTSEIIPLSSEGRGGDRKTQQVHDVQEENLKNKNNLAADLLEIWNQTVGKEQGEGGSLIQLTKKRAQYLMAAFKFRFESNQVKWKRFCQQVASSDFLMGKIKSTFKASLDWVLKFDIMQRILEGDFGVKEIPGADEESAQMKAETLNTTIDTSCEAEIVKRFRKSILKTFGEQTYQSWFADMTITQKGRGLELHAHSPFASDYVQTHYLNKLNALTDHGISISG